MAYSKRRTFERELPPIKIPFSTNHPELTSHPHSLLISFPTEYTTSVYPLALLRSSAVNNVRNKVSTRGIPRKGRRRAAKRRNEAIKQSAGRAAVRLPPAIGAAGPEGDPGEWAAQQGISRPRGYSTVNRAVTKWNVQVNLCRRNGLSVDRPFEKRTRGGGKGGGKLIEARTIPWKIDRFEFEDCREFKSVPRENSSNCFLRGVNRIPCYLVNNNLRFVKI